MRSHDPPPRLRSADVARGDVQQQAIALAIERVSEPNREAKVRNRTPSFQRTGAVVGRHQQRDTHTHRLPGFPTA